MKKSLAHLPQLKQDELELIAMNIRALCDDVHKVILFGSYVRYDMHYKITKEQLEQLAPRVKKLHEMTEKACKEKISSFDLNSKPKH